MVWLEIGSRERDQAALAGGLRTATGRSWNSLAAAMPSALKRIISTTWMMANGGSDPFGASACGDDTIPEIIPNAATKPEGIPTGLMAE